jgi:hypothetical protein
MDTDITFENNSNLTTITTTTTTTFTSGYDTVSTTPSDSDDLKSILSYAIPFSCLALFLVLLVVIGICHRHRVLEKWTSLKRMKNTNPKLRQSMGLRRDSEFDSYDHEPAIKSTTNHLETTQEYSLSTVS